MESKSNEPLSISVYRAPARRPNEQCLWATAESRASGCFRGSGGEAERAVARPRKRDRPALRFDAAMAEESAVLEARARRRALEGPSPSHGRFGCKSKLRRTGTCRDRRQKRRRGPRDRLRSEPRVG